MNKMQTAAAVCAAFLALSGTAAVLPEFPVPAALTAYAAENTVTVDGIVYTLYADHAAVTDYTGNAKELIIPGTVEGLSVTAVEKEAFSNTHAVSVTLPESVTVIGDGAFCAMYSLESVTCPGVKEIGMQAFYMDEKLQSFTFPEGLTKIGMLAFSGCKRLAKINVPSTLTEIGSDAFLGTAWFTAQQQFEVPVEINNIVIAAAQSKGVVTIPDGVTVINTAAFANCKNITEIQLPDSVTEIKADAFSGCTALTTLTLPAGVTVIPDGMCSGCTALTAFEAAGKVTAVGDNAFRNTGLTDIELPDTVTVVGKSAFQDCKELKRFQIPGLRKIGPSAFRDCESLYWFDEGKIEEIGDFAFMGCNALTAYTSASALKHVGYGAFKECQKLKKVYLRDNLSSVDLFAFSGCPALESVTIYNSFAKLGEYICLDSPNAVLSGYDGSTTEQYAKDNKLEFKSLGEAPKLLYGDINGNGAVGVDDAQTILKAYTETMAGNKFELLEMQAKAADVNKDGEISVEDAQLTLRYYTEKYVAGKNITWEDIRKGIDVPNAT